LDALVLLGTAGCKAAVFGTLADEIFARDFGFIGSVR
jgi:hypothetical protein